MSRKTRMRRAQQQQTARPTLDDDIEVLDAPEDVDLGVLEAVDAAPEREEGEDPYAILQRNFEAANKAKEETEARYQESERRRQAAERERRELSGQVAQAETSELENSRALIQHAYTATEAEARDAEQAYANAMNEGDYAAAAKAQRALVRLETKLTKLEEGYVAIEDRIKNPPKREAPRQEAPQDAFEAQVEQLHPNLRPWAREHKEDLMKRYQLALAADNMAVARGLAIGSDEYLDFMDEQMGYSYEEPEEPAPRAAPPAPRRKAVPAAPVSRTGTGDDGKVYLTSFDKAQARSLGYTDREYAAFVREAPKSKHAKKLGMVLARRGE